MTTKWFEKGYEEEDNFLEQLKVEDKEMWLKTAKTSWKKWRSRALSFWLSIPFKSILFCFPYLQIQKKIKNKMCQNHVRL